MFIWTIDREVFWALDIILDMKIKIKVDVNVMRMVYNIIQAHIYYDFTTFILEEIKKNIAIVAHGDI